MTFEECCSKIVAGSRDPKQAKQLHYAFNYARTGMSMTDSVTQKVQAIYILNNISRWRGDEARAVRAALKKIGGVK